MPYFLGVNLEFVLPRSDFRIQHEEFRSLVFTYLLIKIIIKKSFKIVLSSKYDFLKFAHNPKGTNIDGKQQDQ